MQQIADTVGISTGSVKIYCKTPAYDKSAATGHYVWPENEGLSTQSIKWKFERSICQFSKPSEVQGAGISAGKIMCTVFCDAEGILPNDYMQHNVTITGAYHADLLCKLLITSKEKHQGKLTEVPVVLHDNAPVHSHILDRCFTWMCHPPYSHDLAPSDYHMFLNLKKHFHRQRFSTDDELKYDTEE